MAEVALKKKSGPVLRCTDAATMSTSTATLGILQGTGPLRNSIIVSVAKIFYQENDAHGLNF